MSVLRLRYKCCFVGNFGVGKTSFIHSLLGMSLENVQSTLGIDFFKTSLRVHNSLVHITLWDTAGAERYQSLMHSYVRDSDIVFVLYDLADPNAMRSVERYLKKLEHIQPPVVAVLGTKSDLGHLSHDVYSTIEPWNRQRWKIVTGTCSSRHPESTKKMLMRCLKMIVPMPEVANVKSKAVRLVSAEPKHNTCCT